MAACLTLFRPSDAIMVPNPTRRKVGHSHPIRHLKILEAPEAACAPMVFDVARILVCINRETYLKASL